LRGWRPRFVDSHCRHRSLQDLIGFLSELHALGIDLALHQQGIDTTTPAGKVISAEAAGLAGDHYYLSDSPQDVPYTNMISARYALVAAGVPSERITYNAYNSGIAFTGGNNVLGVG
jgi:hypothetical protein